MRRGKLEKPKETAGELRGRGAWYEGDGWAAGCLCKFTKTKLAEGQGQALRVEG